MSAPNITATWATSTLFVSPGDSWDGDPTKVTPPTGKRDEGWEPTEVWPAEFMNSWKNLVGRWTGFLDSIKNLHGFSLAPNAQVKALAFQVLEDIAFHPNGNEHDAPQFIAVGGFGAASALIRSDQGDFWKSASFLAMSDPNSVAADLSDPTSPVWVAVGDGQEIETSTSAGQTGSWAIRVSAIVAGALTRVRFGNSLFVCLGNSNEIQTSPLGTTWTTRVNPSGTDLNDLHFANGIWTIVGKTGTVLTSADGLTWTDRSAFMGATTDLIAVVYDAANALWIAGGTQELWTTTDPDAVAWIDRSSAFGFSGAQQIKSLATDGNGITMAVRQLGVAADEVDGIGISHDGGVTWEVRDFDFGEPDGRLRTALFRAGRWFVVGEDAANVGLVLTSGRI